MYISMHPLLASYQDGPKMLFEEKKNYCNYLLYMYTVSLMMKDSYFSLNISLL